MKRSDLKNLTRANRIRELLRDPDNQKLGNRQVAALVGPACRPSDVWAVRNRKPKPHSTSDIVSKAYRARRELRDSLQGWGEVKHVHAELWAGEECLRKVGKKLCAGINRVKGAPVCAPCQAAISASAVRSGLSRRGGGRL